MMTERENTGAPAAPESAPSASQPGGRVAPNGYDGAVRVALTVLGFAAGYALLQEVGLALRLPPVNAAAFWPATGFAVWCFWRTPSRHWPLLLAALAVVNVGGNILHGNTVALSVGFLVVNALEPVAGALLLRRLTSASRRLWSPSWITRALVPAAVLPTAVGGVLAAVVLLTIGGSDASPISLWRTWFVADALGVLVGLPAFAAWRELRWPRRPSRERWVDALAVVAVQGALLAVMENPVNVATAWVWPFALLPAVQWSAARLGPGFTALVSGGTTVVVVWGTAQGWGPFAAPASADLRLLGVQVFCAALLVSSLLIASVIAARDEAEAQLRRQSDVLENAVEGVAFVDREGRYTSLNRAYAEILGSTPGELRGTPAAGSVHEGDRELLDGAVARMLDVGRTSTSVASRGADGSSRRVELTLIPEYSPSGDHVGHHRFMRDVSDREAAHATIDQLFRLSPDLLAVLDIDGRFQRLNPAWEQVLGHPVDSMVGRSLTAFVHPDDLQRTTAEFRTMQEGGESTQFENRCRHWDGSYRWLRWNAATDDQRRLVYAAARDATLAKSSERSMASARDEALEASRLKSQFLATMSHEIRTPMNGVIGLSDLLADTTLDPTQERYVSKLQTAGAALLGVINDILDFSKIESGKFVLDDVAFSLASLTEDVVALSDEAARRKGLTMRHELAPGLPDSLRGDPIRLRQVLLNLVGNAVKFTERGDVALRVHPCEDQPDRVTRVDRGLAEGQRVDVCFEVTDTGVGMATDTIATLFDPFTQADDSSTRAHGGTGLGLAISRQLVEAMGGSIDVDSEIGAGTTFRVHVPLAYAPTVAGDSAHDPAELQILVVDDDETNRVLLQQQIRSWGMHADVAAGGAEALEVLRRSAAYDRRYDVAVVDMRMPEQSGLDLADEIARHPGIPPLPVVLLSSTEALTPAQARRAGIGASMTKPVTRSSLYNALIRVATERAAPDGSGTDAASARVLLVEDNDINQTVAASVLARLGYVVDVAVDGIEALAMARQQPYQAILMDCQMPRMDGYTATQRLRATPTTARIPIIAMTANALKEDRDRCLAVGMDDYLPKPIRAHDMEATLARWVGALSPRHSPESMIVDAGLPDDALAIRDRLHEIAGDRTPVEVAFVHRLARTFQDRVPSVLAAVDDAVRRRDWAAVAQEAHSLKGAALNLGAQAVVDACTSIEAAAGRAGTGAPDLGGLRERLGIALRETVAVVAAEVSALDRN